jgi:hypothetical protein
VVIDFSNQQVMRRMGGFLASLDVKDGVLISGVCHQRYRPFPRLDSENSSLCPKLIPINSADIQHCEHAVQEEVAEGLHRWL